MSTFQKNSQNSAIDDFPKTYDAKLTEHKWYTFWENSGFFTANAPSSKPPYCIVIPPPNVTGHLHMGHALDNTLQDILIRYKRMKGYEVLWQPGTDHAGIATQTVVERHLLRVYGKKRQEFSREEFLQHVWEQKEKSENMILSQLRRLGSSLDWTKTRFTLDQGCSRAVRVIFKRLFDEGLIYRGDYLVNWDPITKTALADDEVEYEEKEGFLFYFTYPLLDNSGTISFATTRPETMLGDVALAVSPKDERYKHLIGSFAIQPITHRHLPIIADNLVDPEFGTGCVKITPAHDYNDYEMGQRHGLPLVSIMNDDGTLNEKTGDYQGLTMLAAREKITDAMQQCGHFLKKDSYTTRIGVSYRSKAIIEPHLSKQWFINMAFFKDTLKNTVLDQKTKLLPPHFVDQYCHWIDNLRDWCISRQLVWGHQIPIWYSKQDPSHLICYDGDTAPEEVIQNPDQWTRDPDVLDTWFSSALWPFATLGWPQETELLKKFYPNSTLITGHDILFFWVARMIMMGTYALGSPPFPEVFLHGLIYSKSYFKMGSHGSIEYVTDQERKAYDLGEALPKGVHAKWEKMSKTKGNVIDPIEIIEEYGADACRMALAFSTTDARQIDLDRRRFEEFKNFANKLWNGSRFVLMNICETLTPKILAEGINYSLLTLEDKWILQEASSTIHAVEKHLANYTFDKAAKAAYEFFWDKFCSLYLEMTKPALFGNVGSTHDKENKQKVLVIVLLQSLRLLHPMAPFVTEEIFSHIQALFTEVTAYQTADPLTQDTITALASTCCMKAPFPSASLEENQDVTREFSIIERIIWALRNIRGEMKIPQKTTVDVVFVSTNASLQPLLATQKHIIAALAKVQNIEFAETSPQSNTSSMTVEDITIHVRLPEEMIQQEQKRLKKECEKIQAQLDKCLQQKSNPQFLEKAPTHVLTALETQICSLQEELVRIQALVTMHNVGE